MDMNTDFEEVVIVDYELGNLFSVKHACNHVGLQTLISTDKKKIEKAKAIILPGVGAFGDAMNNLEKLDLILPIKEFIASGKPFLGVCLGMQLLFEESEEFGAKHGLGVVKGVIKKFPSEYENKRMRIPQIAWNHIEKPENVEWEQTPLQGIKDKEFMYFVHSFYAQPSNKENVLTTTHYNEFEYCSAIKNENVFAMQFHPEKSGKMGLEIYKNWYSQIKQIK